jgi:hypothetical protein
MEAMTGLVIGYLLGTRAGEDGYAELRDALATITSSEEVRGIALGIVCLLRDAARYGWSSLTQRPDVVDERAALRRAG